MDGLMTWTVIGMFLLGILMIRACINEIKK